MVEKTPQRSGASISPEERIAKSAAAKAIQTVDLLTRKFPAKGKTAHHGAYHTLAD